MHYIIVRLQLDDKIIDSDWNKAKSSKWQECLCLITSELEYVDTRVHLAHLCLPIGKICDITLPCDWMFGDCCMCTQLSAWDHLYYSRTTIYILSVNLDVNRGIFPFLYFLTYIETHTLEVFLSDSFSNFVKSLCTVTM